MKFQIPEDQIEFAEELIPADGYADECLYIKAMWMGLEGTAIVFQAAYEGGEHWDWCLDDDELARYREIAVNDLTKQAVNIWHAISTFKEGVR